MRSLEDAPVSGKKVLLRLALDVPLSGGAEPLVLDDTRLKESLSTIHYLLNRQARVVIIGKLGRPHGQRQASLSLRPVYLHLSALLKKPIVFCPTLLGERTAQAVESLKVGEIVGLENTGFEKGEDDNSRTLAKQLAGYGDIYVNDAFSKVHRSEASTVAITEFLPSYAGLSLEKEYQTLTSLLRHPARPFVAVIGGAKADKLPVIGHLLHKADRILVGGGVANIFLAAEGRDVGSSVIETDYLDDAKAILRRSRGKIVLPTDDRRSTGGQIFDIGPETTSEFSRVIKGAKTIFWNGNLGKSEDEAFRAGSDGIARAIANSGATTIVGGGNTTEIINRLQLTAEISFISSGGGAALALLSGEKLPGITALNG